ncbi:hypothetical protein ASPZODRAFT_164617 [Penicilliopsis zonata CBS 506.65]|uniref:Uncharacterized protein n=1 Tax=Penicilliopsis zonata CBS 506.65 TaxID=1073090 RepID=A0A1L9SPC2_9EURO|nr:hypothetical protein ASPZODRAFT_164617 [Penicilliopsis zonata CBS 506.65]OJJ49040.1 hypothetical protein ASPZODRAFT_164617 [Penicilliopsis zonata CBS 506.65]
MAAYSPSLATCGIDQMTFLRFIEECNEALLGNKWIAGVQVVALGVSLTPELIVTGVSMAVQAAAATANKAQVRYKTNQVLDRYNEDLFGPRGLYCMVVGYNPDPSPQDPSPGSSPLQQLSSNIHRRLRDPVSSTVRGTEGLPAAVAPLIYFDDRRQLDVLMGRREPVDSSSIEAPKKPSTAEKAKNAFAAYNDYLDRRARAKYTAENQGDILNVPVTRGFKNRYLDPNHPATNNGLIGLLSGGYLARRKQQHTSRQGDDQESRLVDEYQARLRDIARQNRRPTEIDRQLRQCHEEYSRRIQDLQRTKREEDNTGKDRRIRKDILYLAIVNKPSPAQLAAVSTQLSGSRINMADI